jgi:site-specific recombinase
VSLDKMLAELANPETSAVKSMVLIVDWLRPGRREATDAVADRMTGLAAILQARPDLHQQLAARLQGWLDEARFFQLLTGLGLYSRRGFLKEMGERLYERLNPSPVDMTSVKDVFFIVFRRKSDIEWVAQVPDDAWINLLFTLWQFSPEALASTQERLRHEVLYAIELLSIWIAAEELEPAILRLDPRILKRDSAFVALQRELALYTQAYPKWLSDPETARLDDAHARVLLEQCEEELARLRRRTVSCGTSVALTHLLERLSQTLARIELLLDVVDPDDPEKRRRRGVELFRQLVQAMAARHSVGALWQQNTRLLARSVTENSSDHGEHYIAGSRREYFRMLASGAGGGFIIAFMALIKIQILGLGLADFPQTVLVSLNYGLGFVLIHMLHCTVATKQPAMTAASIAEKVEQGEHGRANARKLAELLVRVGRTQFVAILGNVAVALSVAFLIGWGYSQWQGGAPLIGSERYEYILSGIHPWQSPALFYAAIAGLWLFVSGLIAGWFDNRSAYLDMEARLRGHPVLRAVLPAGARDWLARYASENYGALMSNFTFGVLLGSTGYIGHQLGLPIDIRHVAFSSADVGYAMSVDIPSAQAFVCFVLFALLIGGVNLVVSFALALNVALRARGTRIASISKLLKAYFQVLRERPAGLLYPPADVVPVDEEVPAEGKPEKKEHKKGDADSAA